MNRFFTITLIAVLIASAALASGVVAAQSQSNETATTEEEPSEIVLEIDNTTRVTNVDWGEDTARVTLESTSEDWTEVTIYDISPINEQGGHQIDDESVTLQGNETATVEIDIAKPNNPQLSLSTSSGAALLVGDGGGWSPFRGVTVTWAHVQLGAISAAFGALFAFLLISWHSIADRHDSAELVNP